MEEEHKGETLPGYVDWKNRPALRNKHGGAIAASFVLAAEVMENLAFLANASNLVTFLATFMKFSPASAATAVTNFMGTSFLLALLGGFLSDAFFTTYIIFVSSAAIEFLGLVILTAQAWSPRLKQPECEKTMLFTGLYVVAAGVGGIKGSLPTHGAEQFDGDTEKGRRERSTFFNYFVFCLSTGGLIAVTFIVWIEDNKGWQWGFAASTISIAISAVCFISGSAFTRSKLPTGSPLTTIAKVLLAAIVNSFGDKGSEIQTQNPSDMLKFLNSAVKKNPNFQVLTCTVEELEEVKTVVRILPFFFSTVMLNCCLAQLSTFSVQQAATMNTKLGALVIPPASLPIFPVTFIIILAQRIGTGLVLSILAMAVAALVEIKRKSTAEKSGKLESTDHLPISFFWVAIQYLFLGSADLFTLAGLLEFFFTEAPWRMRSMATSLSWASLAMGYYLSSVLVEVVNGATSPHPWLSGKNLNFYRLERFYWLMAVLSALNFLQFLFWAARYNYRMPTDKA